MAENSGMYGKSGEYAFVPVALGFFFGALFVFAADQLMHFFRIGSAELMIGSFLNTCTINFVFYQLFYILKT